METDRVSLKIAELDNDDKPREKALNLGIEHLTNAELIAILLRSGMKGMSVIDISREILRTADNKLSVLSRMSIHELNSKFKGIGTTKAITLMAAFELGTRCANSLALEETSPQIRSSVDIYSYMRQRVERKTFEEFWIIYLNHANRIQSAECVSKGGLASTIVDVKLILKNAIDKLASGLILVHNHPSGSLKPSLPDDKITKKIKDAAQFIDLNVIDHIIISPIGYYSYADEGRL